MEVLNIDFEQVYNLSKKDDSANSLEEDVIVYDSERLIGERILNPETTPPIRIDASIFFLCRYGEITFNVDFKTYRLTKGSMLSLNGHHIIENIHISNNCKAYSLVISQKLLMSIVEWVPELKNMVTSSYQSEPLVELEENELKRIVDVIESIKKNIKATDHFFHNRMVKNETVKFILELADIHIKRVKQEGGSTSRESRKDETIRKFVQLILDHCKQEHEVAFYANKLSMTPSNLSRAIANASGKSPIKWIHDALMAEAKILLRKPDINIQQVSDKLNFGDQSSFGKFFKKYMGLTPMEYRSNIQKNG